MEPILFRNTWSSFSMNRTIYAFLYSNNLDVFGERIIFIDVFCVANNTFIAQLLGNG